MGGWGVLEGALRGVLGVQRGFQEVAGFLGVKGVMEEFFLVGGRKGDRGGIGGADVVEVVMAEGCGVEVRKIAPGVPVGSREFCVRECQWSPPGWRVVGSMDSVDAMSKRQQLDSQPGKKLFFCYIWPG